MNWIAITANHFNSVSLWPLQSTV